MYTLPVNVYGLLWSKMIVACVWFAATFIVVGPMLTLTGLFQTGTSLSEVFEALPTWKEIAAALNETGLRGGDLVLFIAERIIEVLLSGLVRMSALEHPLGNLEDVRDKVNMIHMIIGECLFVEAVQAAAMNIAAALGIKKGLNLV